MIAAMGVPSASRNIPSTISFFETLAPDDFADAGFVSGPSAGVLDAITLCFPDEGRVARDGFGFADFDWRLRAAILSSVISAPAPMLPPIEADKPLLLR
jgi:hypothetical protein